MALNPYGGFNHRSPLSPCPSDPPLDLASDCIRDYFGPSVQTVADCLRSRGPSTLPQLVSRVRSQCRRVVNEERERLVERLPAAATMGGSGGGAADPAAAACKPRINKAAGPEAAGYIVDAAPVRAALIVLLQHSLVTAASPPATSKHHGGVLHYVYSFLPERARLLPRYPRYVEHARKAFATGSGADEKAMGDYAASVVEEVLLNGRMRTEDLVRNAINAMRHRLESSNHDDDHDDEDDNNDSGLDEAKLTELREGVVEALKNLIEAGYFELVKPIDESPPVADEEAEFGAENDDGVTAAAAASTTSKKRKRSGSSSSAGRKKAENEEEVPSGVEPDDADVVALLRTKQNRAFFTQGAVWRANTHMFHDSLRAFCLGRLMAERYGDRVQSAGSIISASLKLLARRDHGFDGAARDDDRYSDESTTFCPDEILEFLPGPIRTNLEAKRGGAALNLSNALVALTELDWPRSVMEVEDARGHPRNGRFEIHIHDILGYLRQRVLHQMIVDHHGEVAARIVSILQSKGHLDADAIADAAMVPAKDVREILHRLYKANYISLLVLQQSKQYNPSNAYYLWHVENDRLFQKVTDNVCKACLHLRLRRRHEMELGKDWVERAKEQTMVDENEHKLDRENYNKFCQGLERLDNATLQLDETLMVLRDF
jgi:DNA-directed RNA polymerase III subunit RPC3